MGLTTLELAGILAVSPYSPTGQTQKVRALGERRIGLSSHCFPSSASSGGRNGLFFSLIQFKSTCLYHTQAVYQERHVDSVSGSLESPEETEIALDSGALLWEGRFCVA